MCVKLILGGLDLALTSRNLHLTSTYICGMILTPRVCGDRLTLTLALSVNVATLIVFYFNKLT